MSSIYLSEQMKKRLVEAARARGYRVQRGSHSQLSEYIDYLLKLDGSFSSSPTPTLNRAKGLLKEPGRESPNDEEVKRILEESALGYDGQAGSF